VGLGRVYSYTTCHRAPAPGFETPYVLAIVDLDEGWSILANLVECRPDELEVGLAVAVTWLDLGEGFLLPVFRPHPR
jgi:uncharacterized OB-fold protein